MFLAQSYTHSSEGNFQKKFIDYLRYDLANKTLFDGDHLLQKGCHPGAGGRHRLSQEVAEHDFNGGNQGGTNN